MVTGHEPTCISVARCARIIIWSLALSLPTPLAFLTPLCLLLGVCPEYARLDGGINMRAGIAGHVSGRLCQAPSGCTIELKDNPSTLADHCIQLGGQASKALDKETQSVCWWIGRLVR